MFGEVRWIMTCLLHFRGGPRNLVSTSVDFQGLQCILVFYCFLYSQDAELANSAYNLAVCLAQQGQDAEAEACFRKAVEAYTRAFGPEDPYTLDAIFNLAVALEDQDERAEAEKLYKAAADGRARTFGDVLQTFGKLNKHS